MPHREPRLKLTDAERLSRRLMEMVGAALRKSPPTDMAFACRVMRAERDAWLKPDLADDAYSKARSALAEGKITERVVLIEIVSNCVTKILAHETAKAAHREKQSAAAALEKFRAGGEVVPFTDEKAPAP